MTRTGWLVISLMLATGGAALADDTSTTSQSIVGGDTTAVGQYPSVVAVRAGNALCTGTLVSPDWVLTAAHCLLPSEIGMQTQAQVTASVKVYFGTVNLHASSGTAVAAADTIPDPSFDPKALGANDIGLIELATPVDDVKLVPIDLTAGDKLYGLDATTVGYGITAAEASTTAGIERAVTRTLVSCSSIGGSDANLICISQGDGKGTCSGDSGGPTFAQVGGATVQIGVTSFGDESCTTYGADTRIDAERAFLLDHAPELAELSPAAATTSSDAGAASTDSSGGGCDAGGGGGAAGGLLVGLAAAIAVRTGSSRRSSPRVDNRRQ